MENLNKKAIAEDLEFKQNCEKCFKSHGKKCESIDCFQLKTEDSEFETQNPEYVKQLRNKVLGLDKEAKCNCSRYPQINFSLINLDSEAIETYLICAYCHKKRFVHVVLIRDYIKRLETQKLITETLRKTEETEKLDKLIIRFRRMLETGNYEQ